MTEFNSFEEIFVDKIRIEMKKFHDLVTSNSENTHETIGWAIHYYTRIKSSLETLREFIPSCDPETAHNLTVIRDELSEQFFAMTKFARK